MMMKKPILILFPVLFCACVSVGYAADKLPALPDIKGYGDDAAARQKSRQALDAASQAAKHGAVRAFPNIKVPSSGVDIGQIADRYSQTAIKPADENLMIFVTLGMPDKALLKLARQAARTRAVLVLRGVQGGLDKGNWPRAMEALKPIAETGASIIIHPDLFRAYKVVQAPTFVLTTDRQGDACLSDQKKECSQSLRATGDVSLDYVLERWSDGSGKLASEARARLTMLEGKP
ncbi:MAG: type-F conjugative transfer system pilin assembly protein TrbC [Hydrogenophilales bacterium 17-61-9]|nr:MAG: type-F conjugative transfer system pilin assembly protein TrbC [Hydrogenophilales bacterium 17-61-9]